MRLVVLSILTVTACAPESTQHEITAPGDLLTSDGRLREPGWARRQLLIWDAARVADPAALRQWDFFTIVSDAAAVNLTLADIGFARLCSVGVVDFASGQKRETMVFGSAQGLSLSAAAEGQASLVRDGAPLMTFATTADSSAVTIDIPASLIGDAASGSFTIHRRPSMPYLSLATPFREEPHLFFYEQKISGMSADGAVRIGDRTWTFAGAGAVMDWGRGAWPAAVTWRWAAASGSAGGKTLAFNLGDVGGDATFGTENLVVHADVAHKLADVDWTFDANDPMRDWTFRAPDGRLSLVLHPIAHEIAVLDLGGKHSRLHKAYGRYVGTIVLDDDRSVRVDGLLGFAEEVDLAW